MLGGFIGKNENELDLYRIQKDSIYDQHSINAGNDKNLNLKGGADFFIDSKNTIGFLVTTKFGQQRMGQHKQHQCLLQTYQCIYQNITGIQYNSGAQEQFEFKYQLPLCRYKR
jgi:hypothetical protein